MSALLAILTAIIGALPLVTKPIRAIIVAIVYFLVSWWIYYGACPSFAYPLWGAAGTLIVGGWIISAFIASFDEDGDMEINWSITFPILGVCSLLIIGISGCAAFRSSQYSRLIGTVENKQWSQDIQPTDPRHVRLVPAELAYYLATKQLGEAPGTIGSQFQIEFSTLTLQVVNGELWYVAPLELSGFSVWTSVGSSPGYVMVSGEDPKAPVVIKLGQKFRYLDSAFFGDNIERLLWNRYAGRYSLQDFTFEVDDNGKGWWTITALKPTIGWWGLKVEGVIVVAQAELLGDAVELTDDYRCWWSYIPHFINTPGYVYAYSYGQLLALSVYDRYLAEGSDFEARYLELLRSGGSRSPEELGEIVGIELADPGFLGGGLGL